MSFLTVFCEILAAIDDDANQHSASWTVMDVFLVKSDRMHVPPTA